MNEPVTLYFESELHTSKDKGWEWITSVEGISKEISPFFRMTTPKHIKSLNDIQYS